MKPLKLERVMLLYVDIGDLEICALFGIKKKFSIEIFGGPSFVILFKQAFPSFFEITFRNSMPV